MAPITSSLDTRRLPDGKRILISDLYMHDGSVVPKGFITDFSSIPYALLIVIMVMITMYLSVFHNVEYNGIQFLLLLLAAHWTRVDIAGVKHDWDYWSGVNKFIADWRWYKNAARGQHRANKVQGLTMFIMLSMFGWGPYLIHLIRRKRRAKNNGKT